MQRAQLRRVFAILFALMAACEEPHDFTLLSNPGFEAGELDPWLQGIGVLDYPHDEFWSVTSDSAHSGNWSATNVGNNELRQEFAAVPVSAISEVSFFLRKEGALTTAVQLHYSDGLHTLVEVSASDAGVWEWHDVTSALEPGKQLVGISTFGVRCDFLCRTSVDDFLIVVQ